MKKPGIDLVIGIGKPKPPKPPAGMSGPVPPMDDDPGGTEGQDDEPAENDRMAMIERKLDKICEALGIDMEEYGPQDKSAEPKEEAQDYE